VNYLHSERRCIFLELEEKLSPLHEARGYVFNELTPANPKKGIKVYQVTRRLFKSEQEFLDSWLPMKKDEEFGTKDLR
jgi:hypothetical protein